MREHIFLKSLFFTAPIINTMWEDLHTMKEEIVEILPIMAIKKLVTRELIKIKETVKKIPYLQKLNECSPS